MRDPLAVEVIAREVRVGEVRDEEEDETGRGKPDNQLVAKSEVEHESEILKLLS
jgi:hypothetical protein